MNRWPTVSLGEICSPKQHPTLATSEFLEEGFPVFGANGQIGFFNRYTHIERTIAITCRGATCGTINITPPRSYITGNAMALDALDNSKVDLAFLAYALKTRGLRDVISGSAQPQITRLPLLDVRVPLPPLDDQRRIAAILDHADDLRRKRRAALLKLNKLSTHLLVYICGDPARNSMDWPISQLGDVCTSVSDGPHVSPEYVQSGVPFLSTRNIRPEGIVWNDLKFISKADAEIQWRKVKPTRGDVLYTKGGTTGIARAVDFDADFAVWVHVAVLKLSTNKVDPAWLQEMLNSSYCYRQSQRLTKGIVNRDLGLRRMVDIAFPLPPLDLQRAFAARISQIEKLKVHYDAHLKKTEALFASLQQRAFCGAL